MSKAVRKKAASLRDRRWKRFLRGPDAALLEELYVPALSVAARYDRCCAYFSSSVLAAAARGFADLIQRLIELGEKAPKPAVRLIVNEELAEEDVRAMLESRDTSALEAHLLKRLKKPKDVLEKQRLEMLGWLVKQGLLDVRVGVMRQGEGIVHAKFGIATDTAGDSVVFSGSGNESAAGLRANYEEIEISSSWGDAERFKYFRERFDILWSDTDVAVHTVLLPDAVRLKLIKFAAKEPPTTEPSNALARQVAEITWRFIAEAPYLENGATTCDATAMVTLWPHQRHVVEDTAAAWPEGRLLCDEVGMGKTIEAIIALRRLMAGRGVRRVIILLPAGLLIQWQQELREKGGLEFPRFDPFKGLVWPDGREERKPDLGEALNSETLILSRETARTESNRQFLLNADPWDLVLLDEAHAARRQSREETEFNSATLLLDLLRQLQLCRKARGFMLLSATPMQTHPWEPWDLLGVLGVGGHWMSEFRNVRDYYRAVHSVADGRCMLPTAKNAALTISLDAGFPKSFGGGPEPSDDEAVAKMLAFAKPDERDSVAKWMRKGSPLARRMHRNTRETLKHYHRLGLLDAPPPRRVIHDEAFDYADAAERRVYDAITKYIDRRFHELEGERAGKGFVVTVYRRRAASSPYALNQSLSRRRDGLRNVADRRAADGYFRYQDIGLDDRDVDEAGVAGEGFGRVSAALPSDPEVATRELREVEGLLDQLDALGGKDSKRDRFFDVLRRITDDGRSVLVFSEYADTMEYLRDLLVDHYGTALGCYSGDGGQIWNGSKWEIVSKDTITTLLRNDKLRVLICTDAASEGLNLQAAGALINYDLPWNPSKVEQRIGRIDRIGQKHRDVRIVNFFLRNSVDEKVYTALRQRCGLFEHFVGPMQPVLAAARGVLLGQAGQKLEDVLRKVDEVQSEPLTEEAYLESDAQAMTMEPPVVAHEDIRQALQLLNGSFGVEAKEVGDRRFKISGVEGVKSALGLSEEALERDVAAVPLTALSPEVRAVSEVLGRPGERLPLVTASAQDGAYRATYAIWVANDVSEPLRSMFELRKRLESWDGHYPDARKWLAAVEKAKRHAAALVDAMKASGLKREGDGLAQQVDAARLRLLRELGRHLVCLHADTGALNATLHAQMQRPDIASRDRLRRAIDRLGGGYPEWPQHVLQELQAYAQAMSDNERRGRLIGAEIDAALADPRWVAAG